MGCVGLDAALQQSAVILDFKGITIIGQPFADEVFRVFQNAHPNTLNISVVRSRRISLIRASELTFQNHHINRESHPAECRMAKKD